MDTGYRPRSPYGICARCGFQRRLRDLAKEWTNLRVCRDKCLDPRPPETRPPRVGPEGLPVSFISPEPDPVFRDPGDNGRSAL